MNESIVNEVDVVEQIDTTKSREIQSVLELRD